MKWEADLLGLEVSPSSCGAKSSAGKWEIVANLRKSCFLFKLVWSWTTCFMIWLQKTHLCNSWVMKLEAVVEMKAELKESCFWSLALLFISN